MSGKGSSSNHNNNSGGGGGGKTSGASGGTNTSAPSSEPSVVSGWQYHTYSQGSQDRYAYIGKGGDGTPEFLDYGPKSSRK